VNILILVAIAFPFCTDLTGKSKKEEQKENCLMSYRLLQATYGDKAEEALLLCISKAESQYD
ncbi:hypothetical protein, partial [Leptospira sp. id769339]